MSSRSPGRTSPCGESFREWFFRCRRSTPLGVRSAMRPGSTVAREEIVHCPANPGIIVTRAAELLGMSRATIAARCRGTAPRAEQPPQRPARAQRRRRRRGRNGRRKRPVLRCRQEHARTGKRNQDELIVNCASRIVRRLIMFPVPGRFLAGIRGLLRGRCGRIRRRVILISRPGRCAAFPPRCGVDPCE